MNITYNPNIKYISKRLFFAVFAVSAILLIFFFRLPKVYIQEFDFNIYNPIYEITKDFPLWIYLLVYFIAVFLLNSLLLIIYSIYTISKNKRKEDKRKKYLTFFSIEIINIIYPVPHITPEKMQTELGVLKRNINNYLKSRVFFEALIKTSSVVKGELRERTNALFQHVYNDSYVKAHLLSPYFQDRIFALQLIVIFYLAKYENIVKKMTNEKNYLLRTEAYITLIKISNYDNLSFLKTHKYNISELDKNIILNVIQENKKENIDVLGLLESPNPKSAHLGILLAHKLQKFEFKEIIKEYLESPIILIREEAFVAYASMSETDNEFDYLIQLFPSQNDSIKKTIINEFSRCNNLSLTTAFLLSVIEEESVLVKVEALKLLIDVNVNYVLAYSSTKDEDIQKALKQVLDFNLNM